MALIPKSRRKLWLRVHLYLGLFAGAVFVLIGLTGSLLAFKFSLDEWLNPKLMTVPVDKETKQPPAKAGGFTLRTGSPDTRRLNDASYGGSILNSSFGLGSK